MSGSTTVEIIVTSESRNGNPPRRNRMTIDLPGEAWTGRVSFNVVKGTPSQKRTVAAARHVCRQCGTDAHVVEVDVETGMRP